MNLNLRKLDRTDKFVLLLGLCNVIKIRVLGTFSISELLLIFVYFTPSIKSYKRDKNCKKLISFSLLWLLGTCVSNYANAIETIDFVKGVFFLVFFIVLIPPIYALVSNKPERILLYALGAGVAALYSRFFAATENIRETLASDVYTFYAYAAFVSTIAYLLYFNGKKKLGIILKEGIAIVTLFHASRNYFLTTTIAAMVLLVSMRPQITMKQTIKSYRQKIPMLLITGLLGAVMVSSIYEYSASNGLLGDAAYEKYMKQSQAENMLQGGRVVTFMGIELIKKKPIIGWGSYAKDTWGFRSSYYMQHNMTDETDPYGTPLLPAHSHIVGAWMQNGILGGLFWSFVLYLIWKIFSSGCLLYEQRILGLVMFQIVAFIWDWAFSPFGDRLYFLFLMLPLLVIYRNYQTGVYATRNYQ